MPLKLKDKKQQHIQTQLGSDLVWCSGEIKKIKKYLFLYCKERKKKYILENKVLNGSELLCITLNHSASTVNNVQK